MEEIKRCQLFRHAEGAASGQKAGFCRMEDSSAVCDGDAWICDKPEILREYLLTRLIREFD